MGGAVPGMGGGVPVTKYHPHSDGGTSDRKELAKLTKQLQIHRCVVDDMYLCILTLYTYTAYTIPG